MTTLRRLTSPLAVLGLAAALAAPVSPSSAALGAEEAPTVDVRPGHLPRGADPAVAHVVGQEIVDGDTRVRVRGRLLDLLGQRDEDYVVEVLRRKGARVLSVTAEGDRSLVTRVPVASDRRLSDDGALLAVARWPGRATTVRVVDTTDGSTVAERAFRGARQLLDVDGDQVLLSSWRSERTMSWFTTPSRVETVVDRVGYAASLADDRLATYTGDPYDGGCSLVTTVSDPATRVWRSCTDRVASFSPGARRMATIHLLSDGPGPNRMTVRRPRGKPVADYVIDRGWLGPVFWESAITPISDVYGRTKRALVRLAGEDTDRASVVSDSPGA